MKKQMKSLFNTIYYTSLALLACNAVDYFMSESVCKIDPTCRNMTDDEARIAKNLFGDKFNTSDIRIFERPIPAKFIIDLFKGYVTRATTLENSIFFSTIPLLNQKNLENSRELFPKEYGNYKGIYDRRTLVHEFTHVAQRQFQIPHNSYEESYNYTKTPNKRFENYGQEQQAELVADYYIRTLQFNIWAQTNKSPSALRSYCRNLNKEREIFKDYFEPKSPEVCVPR